jgi:uncharacterized membrane protein
MQRGRVIDRLVPPNPAFETESEREVWQVLADSLGESEVLFHGLRFTDPKEGDVEIDLLLLSPTRGAAIIEVKGGIVEYVEGQWTTRTNGGATRRIRPVDQARRAKHALRRYLDKSPEWKHGLLRSQWFLALPKTQVVGDMGPEAPRDRLIGQDDLLRTRTIIDEGLRVAPREPAVPQDDWVLQARDLLLNAPDASLSSERYERIHHTGGHGASAVLSVVSLAVAVLVGSLVAIATIGAWGAVIAAVLVCVAVVVGYRIARHRSRIPLAFSLGVVLVAVGAGSAAGLAIRQAEDEVVPKMDLVPSTLQKVRSSGIDVNSLRCHDAYSPCVLDMPWDRNCDDIGFQVAVLGDRDPYGLDRDGDGLGCTAFPESQVGEAPREQTVQG